MGAVVHVKAVYAWLRRCYATQVWQAQVNSSPSMNLAQESSNAAAGAAPKCRLCCYKKKS